MTSAMQKRTGNEEAATGEKASPSSNSSDAVPSSHPQQLSTRAPQPPDGGTHAWLAVSAAFLLFIMTWGPSTAFGSFQDYYQTTLLSDSSASKISWIGAVNAFFLISTGVIAGPLFDRGFLRHLMTVGCILSVFSTMMLSLSNQYYQILLSQGFLSGMGSGLIYVPALSLVNTNFTTKRAIAMGVVTSGASVGGVIFPILFIQMEPRVGFPWTVRTIGFIQLACSLVALPLLMTGPAPKPSAPRKIIHWYALREFTFSAYGFANFFIFMAYFVPLFYVPYLAARNPGVSTELGFYLLSVLNAASAFGRIGASFICRTLGAPNVLLFSVVASTVLLFGWIGVHSLAGSVIFSILFGLVSGLLISVNPLLIAHPVVSPTLSVVGTRMGMQWFATSLGVLVGAPIAGVLVSSGQDTGPLYLQAFSGAVMAVGALFLLVPVFAIWRHNREQVR